MRTVEDLPLVLPGQLPLFKTRASDERYTPSWVLDLVRALDPIAYDPCTAAHNPVGACRFSTADENGLVQDWRAMSAGGLIWVNPPFSSGNILRWAMVAAAWAEEACEIAMLTPLDPTTRWYSVLWESASCFAQLQRRVKYGVPSDQPDLPGGAMQPAGIWYFGHRTRTFARIASKHAHVVFPVGAP